MGCDGNQLEETVGSKGTVATVAVKDTEDMRINPFWAIYKTESIINWRTKKVGSDLKLELVVLREIMQEIQDNDIYSTKDVIMYRVLQLDENGNYIQQLFKEGIVEPISTVEPKKNGEPIKEIPFYIINENGIDYQEVLFPPIYDLSEVNIGHYRNSADYEEELHRMAIKSIVAFGVDEKQVFKMGGFNAIPNTDAKVEILEASSQSGIEKEMINKERRMAILGSQAISGGGKYVQSAETATINKSGEISVLASIANAVSRASEIMLRFTGEWMSKPIDDNASRRRRRPRPARRYR